MFGRECGWIGLVGVVSSVGGDGQPCFVE
jgi:hypothetical protein